MLLPVGILNSVLHTEDTGTARETLLFCTFFSGYRIGTLDVNKNLYIISKAFILYVVFQKNTAKKILSAQGFKLEYPSVKSLC